MLKFSILPPNMGCNIKLSFCVKSEFAAQCLLSDGKAITCTFALIKNLIF